ncbi:hypothetical protein BSK62_08515 [Paenibacillus odorifer]|uniref:hypothetical protein n=1 Tax=Paenibacillus TaxID=44249 RepID=UPI00096EEB73|nr:MULTISPECIES: hypothetical protein [Paenibacillus]MDH6426969.1 DNA polymerase III delta prime subunit [Paenibacillus sp. PastH-4]MDH6442997.1 DNA polymerase III delta prime subunit [Paenibacillus sp. PastF-4]MDH6526295.1 DNA polymerase III delta prime subunit [Paenibacillus sp. PastH-3]OMD67051.1 hypothetical protein BSK62_08515 [Paenibacillus odorifer]
MVSNQVLEAEYYYDSSGRPNEIIQDLGNCLTRNIYFILKDNLEDPELLMSAYIDDFSMILITDNEETILDIQINDIKSPTCYVIMNNGLELKNDGPKAIQYIESLLCKGETVLVNTIMKLVPFYKTFKENSSIEELDVVDNHFFLLLGQTSDEFYYMDNYVNYNKRFKAYPSNKSIGIDFKSSFLNAFNYQFRCCTLKPNYSELKNLNTRIPYIIDQSIKNYKSKMIDNKDERIVYLGRNMLRKFIDLYSKGQIQLNDAIKNRDHDVFSLSRTIFNRNIGRKKILLLFLNNLPYCLSIQKLVDAIEENLVKWELIKNTLTKKYMKNDFLCDEKMEKLLENVLESEDALYQILEESFDFISTISFLNKKKDTDAQEVLS